MASNTIQKIIYENKVRSAENLYRAYNLIPRSALEELDRLYPHLYEFGEMTPQQLGDFINSHSLLEIAELAGQYNEFMESLTKADEPETQPAQKEQLISW
jgi:hypothetical protein